MITSINNFAFHLQQIGDNHKHTLIWSHGLISSIQADDKINIVNFNKLSSVANIVRLDSRSHGLTENDLHHIHLTWKQTALDTIAIADHLDLTEFTVGGTSMGAGAALWVASLAPNRVKKIILHLPPDAWSMRSQVTLNYQAAIKAIKNNGLSKVATTLKQDTHHFLKQHQTAYHAAVDLFCDKGQDTIMAILQGACQSDFPDKDALANLDQPVLILPWENLNGHSIQIATELSILFANATLNIAQNKEQAFAHTDSILTFLHHP